MASYTKSTSIDMNNGEGEKGVGGKHVYETMHDVACDSDNDDDDKVLIDRHQAPPHPLHLGSRKYSGYLGLICNALMLALFVVALVLAFFMFSLHKDIDDVRRSAEIRASHVNLMDKRTIDLGNRMGDVSKQVQRVQNNSNIVLNAVKAVKTFNSSVASVLARASVYYPEFNAKFMGFGYPTNRSHWAEYHQYTLSRCLQNLHEKHALDPSWNGLAFGHSQKDGWCICYKNSGKIGVNSNHYLYYILND